MAEQDPRTPEQTAPPRDLEEFIFFSERDLPTVSDR